MRLLTGTGRLLRLALRRDRVKISIWMVGCAVLFISSTLSVVSFYKTPTELTAYATTSAVSVASRAFNGPVLGATTASVTLTETFSFFTIFVAFMNTLLIVRHTRQEEETGRAELIGGAAVGAYAPVTTAMLLALLVNITFAIVIAAGYLVCGLPIGGAILAGVSMGLMGMVFAGIAAVAAQLAQTARSANAIAGGAIGLFFVIRAVGDVLGTVQPDGTAVKSSWLTMLSPMGIARETQPFIQDNLWPVWALLTLTIVLVVSALALLSHRDIGSGILSVRPGPSVAPPSLSNALGLAWRQQRGLFVGWAVGICLTAVALGSMAREVEKITASSKEMADLIAVLGGSQNLVKAYLAYSMMLFGVMVSGYAIQAMQKIRTEESDGRLELVLAGSVHRVSWLWSHIMLVAIGATMLMIICGVVTGLTHGIIVNDVYQQISSLLIAGLVQVPAILIFIGIPVLIYSLLPRLTIMLSWLVFAVLYVVVQFGEIYKLPQWAMDISPFIHTPAVPAQDLVWTPLIIMTTIAFAMLVTGTILFRRRNLTTV